jgi:hypothetical protein
MPAALVDSAGDVHVPPGAVHRTWYVCAGSAAGPSVHTMVALVDVSALAARFNGATGSIYATTRSGAEHVAPAALLART